jgi:PD-(D/E)XK nuclease superfamily
MAHYLYPTLEQTLSCPKRYTLEKVQRKDVPAPFMTSELGKQVHSRIAHSLRTGKAANQQEFCLPRRLLLNQGESADTLMTRAYDCLHNFNEHYQPWLAGLEVIAVEQKLCFKPNWFDEPVTISGVIDAIVKTTDGLRLLDWKTGGLIRTDEQLRWYLALYSMDYPDVRLEAWAVNLFSSETILVKDFETPQQWLYTKVKALLTSLQIARDNPYKTVSGQQCWYCPYAQECDSSKAKPRVMLDTVTGELTQIITSGVKYA